MFIQFVVWCLALLAIGYFFSFLGKPNKVKWLQQEWRVYAISQHPDPIDALVEEAQSDARAYMIELQKRGYVRFHRQGHYEVNLFTQSSGLWKLEKEIISLEQNGRTTYLNVEHISANKLVINWQDHGVLTTVTLGL